MRVKIPYDMTNKITMSVNPDEKIVNAGYKVIHEGFIYGYVGIGWCKERQATEKDYETIPELSLFLNVKNEIWLRDSLTQTSTKSLS